MNEFFFNKFKNMIVVKGYLNPFPLEVKQAMCEEQGWTEEQFDSIYKDKSGIIEDLFKKEFMEYLEKEYSHYWKFIEKINVEGYPSIPQWFPITLFLSMWSSTSSPNIKMRLPLMLKKRKQWFLINLNRKYINDTVPYYRIKQEYKSKYGLTFEANLQKKDKFNPFLNWFLINESLIQEIANLYESHIRVHNPKTTIWPLTIYCYYKYLGVTSPVKMVSAIRGLIPLDGMGTISEFIDFINTGTDKGSLFEIITFFRNFYPIETSNGLQRLKRDILRMKEINDKFVNLSIHRNEFKKVLGYHDALYIRNVMDEKLTSYFYEVFINLMHYESIQSEDEI